MPAEQAGPLRVSVVRDPDDLPATTERVRLLNDPDRAILVIRPLPYTTSMNDFAFCVLDGLGKHLPAAPPPGLWNQTLAWVHGYRLRHLVIDRAHTLKPDFRGPLRELLGPPRPEQPRLWLIDAGQAKRRSVVQAFGDLDGLEAVVKVTGAEGLDRVRPEAAPSPAATPIPDRLPADTFMTFRAACARTLEPRIMARVDELWMRTFTEVREWVRHYRCDDAFSPAASVLVGPLSLRLAARTYTAAGDGEILVRLRATQAGLLREGLLLHHQAWPGNSGLGSHLTPVTIGALNRTLSTQDAAAAIVYLLFPFGPRGAETFWHPDDLRLEHLAADASALTISDVRLGVPAHARPALLAHLTFRRKQGARPLDALFPTAKQRPDLHRLAGKALAHTTAAGDLRRDHPARPHEHATVWMTQRRLSLRNLLPATRSLDLSTPSWT
ncbi:hypothetical protein ACWEN6_37675 [Sphaerisporangium sp. NPDC004334]